MKSPGNPLCIPQNRLYIHIKKDGMRMFWFKRWRRKRLANRQFPACWLEIISRNVPFYAKLPMADREELRRHILIFTGEKYFEGCSGLKITDEINKYWIYDPERPEKKVAIYHDAGSGKHIHLQVHPNTRRNENV